LSSRRCPVRRPPRPFPARRSSDLAGVVAEVAQNLLEILALAGKAGIRGAVDRNRDLAVGVNSLERALQRVQHFLHRRRAPDHAEDRKSTRLNSSHVKISYAVICST